MKLARKLTLLFLLIAVVPLVVVGGVAYENSRRALVHQTMNHLISTNALKQAELNRWIEDSKKDLRRLANRPFFIDNFATVLQGHASGGREHGIMHRQIIADHLLPFLETGGFLELFILQPEDGLVVVSTDPAQEDKYQENQSYFLQGKKHTFAQKIIYSQSLEQPVMNLATPIRDRQGRLIAVLAGRLDLAELSKIMLQGEGLTKTEVTYLVNQFNFFVTEPRFGKGFALQKAVHTKGVNAGLQKKQGVGFYDDYRGVPVIGAYKWLPERELCIITEINQSEAFAPIVRMGWMVIGIALAMAIAAAIAAYVFALGITQPVQQLVQGTEIIGGGDLDYQVGTTARDEIGELSRAFDRMTKDLKTTTVSREELVREKNFSDSVINSLPGVFYLFDDKGHFLRWNNNFEKVTKYSAEEIAAMTPLDFFAPAEKPLVAEGIEQAFGEGRATVEADFLTKSGRTIPFYFTGVHIKIEEKEFITGVGIDITERKAEEAALQAAVSELARSNKELEQFAYVASHDLQEPLRMVASYTQLLAERYENQLDAKANKYIHYAVDGAVRMQRLINDLLLYSRVGTRGKPFETADSHALLGEAIRNLAAAIDETHAVVTTDELPLVRVDPAQFVQLFQNLLSNALKFRGEDFPHIHVSVRDAESEWVFSVKDNGLGIDPQYAERIFVIFQRLHTQLEYPGTGIGLAICKRIVERHGGRIWVESNPGKGSTFFFSLTKLREGPYAIAQNPLMPALEKDSKLFLENKSQSSFNS